MEEGEVERNSIDPDFEENILKFNKNLHQSFCFCNNKKSSYSILSCTSIHQDKKNSRFISSVNKQ